MRNHNTLLAISSILDSEFVKFIFLVKGSHAGSIILDQDRICYFEKIRDVIHNVIEGDTIRVFGWTNYENIEVDNSVGPNGYISEVYSTT